MGILVLSSSSFADFLLFGPRKPESALLEEFGRVDVIADR